MSITQQATKQATTLLVAVDAATHLFNALEKIDRHYTGILQTGAMEAQGHNNDHHNKFQQAVAGVVRTLDDLEPDEIYGDVRELLRTLERNTLAPILSEAAQNDLKQRLKSLTTGLNSFFKSNKSLNSTTLLVATAHDVREALKWIQGTVAPLRDALSGQQTLSPGTGRLELTFYSDPTVSNVSGKLALIADLYADAGRLLGEADDPDTLTVFRIEAGTTEILLLGKEAAIKIVAWVLRVAAGQLTRQGRTTSLGKEAGTFKELLEVDDMMRSRGLGTDDNAAALQAIYDAMLERACRLLANEPSIGLDGQELISVRQQTLPAPADLKQLPPVAGPTSPPKRKFGKDV